MRAIVRGAPSVLVVLAAGVLFDAPIRRRQLERRACEKARHEDVADEFVLDPGQVGFGIWHPRNRPVGDRVAGGFQLRDQVGGALRIRAGILQRLPRCRGR
jgi:hypothetical protein